MINRQLILSQRPSGLVDDTTTTLVESPRPECGADQALIKVGMLSIDPTIRTWMNDAPGYLPPIAIGEVVRAGGAGVVVESNSSRYHVGDIVSGITGWQEWVIADENNRFSVIPSGMGLDLATVMNVVGLTGITAYFGLLEVGQFREGDVVVVSGAAGATGSVAGQVAKARGAKKVIGIAGGPEKCAEVVEKYGFDECLDYREASPRTLVARVVLPRAWMSISTMWVARSSTRCSRTSPSMVALFSVERSPNTTRWASPRVSLTPRCSSCVGPAWKGSSSSRTSVRAWPKRNSSWPPWCTTAPWRTRSISYTASSTRPKRSTCSSTVVTMARPSWSWTRVSSWLDQAAAWSHSTSATSARWSLPPSLATRHDPSRGPAPGCGRSECGTRGPRARSHHAFAIPAAGCEARAASS